MPASIDNEVRIIAQQCFSASPVIVLGSGASIPHGLKGMGELAKHLVENLTAEKGCEEDAWLLVRNAINQGDNLEQALQIASSLPASLVEKIIQLTWHFIAEGDLSLLTRAALNQECFPLSALIDKLFKSTATEVNIVTTNYDRVAEYASDKTSFLHCTGFVPGIIRKRHIGDPIKYQKGNQTERIVRIWKVHGSLDWFENERSEVVTLPLSNNSPTGFYPLIVTPGTNKFEKTHKEPFRSIIQGSDLALSKANSFLCIGYGFRDSHIQPKLVEKCRNSNLPIVILAQTLTDEAKNFLTSNNSMQYMALENHENGTRVFTHKNSSGEIIENKKYWKFEEFNKLIL